MMNADTDGHWLDITAFVAALEYLALGWRPIGVVPAILGDHKSGKRAAHTFKQFEYCLPTTRDIRMMFRNLMRNIAILTGLEIIMLDFDGAGALKALRRDIPLTPLMFTTGRDGGEQWIYKAPAIAVHNRVRIKGLKADVRGRGGYSCVPPSMHWTGKQYRWKDWPTPALLAETPVFPLGLLNEDRSFSRSVISIDPMAGRLSLIRRARRYVEKMRPAVSGERGHDWFFHMVCKLLQSAPDGFGLSEGEALGIIESFNARCVPPFSDKEIEHKIASVLSRVRGVTGGMK